MRFQVPQFVDIEDRIIGPLTLKMFAYYAIAGLVLVPLYVLLDLSLFITLALPILGIAALFAHVRLQGQPFITIVSHAAQFYVSPRAYLWRRGGKSYAMIIRGKEYDDFADLGVEATTPLNAIAQMLDTQGNVSAQDAADPLLAEEGSGEIASGAPDKSKT